MLRGMYDFQSSAATTLPFLANEPLLYLGTHPLDNNWLKASNAIGKTGLVPVNYVTIDHDFTGDVVMEFLNGAIRLAQRDKSLKIEELLKLRDRILTPSTDVKDQVIELEDEIRRTRQIAISELGNVDMSYVPRNEQSIKRNQSSHSNSHTTSTASPSTSRNEPSIPHRRKNVSHHNHNRPGPSSSIDTVSN